MSHQGEDGWYPECKKCNAGNLGEVVCKQCYDEEVSMKYRIDWSNADSLYEHDKYKCSYGGEHDFGGRSDREKIEVIVNGDALVQRVKCDKCNLKVMKVFSSKHPEYMLDTVTVL
jgi:hypothetical protein